MCQPDTNLTQNFPFTMSVCKSGNFLLQPLVLPFSTIITLFFFLIIPHVNPLEFDIPSFKDENNNRSITITGDAYISSLGIELTPNPDTNNNKSTWKVGRATYPQPLQLWDQNSGRVTDFTTHFSFVIRKVAGSDLGQGLAFFLSPSGSSIPPNATGGLLGLQSFSLEQNHFIAVEFDTYRNNEWEPDFPINHVGIDVNNMTSVTNVYWNNIFLNNRTYDAWINYDSSTTNLSVVFTSYDEDDTVQQNGLSTIVDLKQYLPEWVTFGFSAATADTFEQNTIVSWDFKASFRGGQKTKKIGLGIAAGCSAVVLCALAFCGLCLWRRRKGGQQARLAFGASIDVDFEKGSGPKKFSYGELARATNNFAEEKKLGEGGFGGVYRGFLKETNANVAVKRISRGSKQGLKEYATEVKIISQLRHRNLVQLIGWCHEKRELLLVYEFMANGSLDTHLYNNENLLTWESRCSIAKGLATGLLYLHEEWEQCVLHRDIKPSNVMLDENFSAKLGDFGLARLVNHQDSSPRTELAGTMGYMAMEYVTTHKASRETDVYSFGVVALEIASGRKPVVLDSDNNWMTTVQWIWELYGMGKVLEAADQKLGGNFNCQEMERLLTVGLWCAHPDYRLRPSIRQAILVLNFESPLPDLPIQMPFVPTNYGLPVNMPTPPPVSSKLEQ